MTAWRKTRAIVALAAAYAVAAQAVLLAVGGPVAGVAGFTTSALCSASKAGAGHPTPGGRDDCPAACAACCCGAPAAASLDVGAAAARERPPAESVAVVPGKIPTWHFNVDPAHRSRAPPLG